MDANRHFIKLIILSLMTLCCNNAQSQIFVANVDYYPRLDQRVNTVINGVDTVKILYVTDSTIVAFIGNEIYDSTNLIDHLRIYPLEDVISFSHYKGGKILKSTVSWAVVFGIAGGLLSSTFYNVDPLTDSNKFLDGFIPASTVGAGVGLISGLARTQNYRWKKDGIINLNVEKIKKFQECNYVLPYHLKAVTEKLEALQ